MQELPLLHIQKPFALLPQVLSEATKMVSLVFKSVSPVSNFVRVSPEPEKYP